MPQMSQRKAEILLASVIIARSTSFVFNKIGLGGFSVYNLMALRYLAAFALLLALLHRQLRGISLKTIGKSALISLVFFAVMFAELSGLKYADSSVICFLENAAVVFVPMFSALLARRFPRPLVLASSGMALLGVFLLTAGSGMGTVGKGEIFGLLAALAYTVYILCNDRMVKSGEALQIGILQNGFLGFYGLAAAVLTGTARLPQNSTEFLCVAMLALVCSAFGLTLQPVAQSRTSAERAGLFCAFSPVASAILGWTVLHEAMSPAGMAGSALILLSVFVPGLQGMKGRLKLWAPARTGSAPVNA